MAHGRFHRTGWTAATGGLAVAVALAASGVAAHATAAAPHPSSVHLTYGCRFPSGAQRVGVTVAATFPAGASVGTPIAPTRARITVTLPHIALTGLSNGGATELTGTDMLSMAVGSGTSPSGTLLWPGQVRKPVTIPASGSLPLHIPSQAPPVTPRTPGTLTFTAAGLALALTPGKPGRAAPTPATVQVPCALEPGQSATLGTVPVISTLPSPSASASPSPGQASRGRPATAPAARGGAAGGVPPGCVKTLVQGGSSSSVLGCANLLGYADVRKLNGAALIGPAFDGSAPAAFLNVDSYAADDNTVNGTLHIYTCSVAQLNYHNQMVFPPAKTTFLAFGFTPVTAELQLSEVPWPSTHPPVEDPRCYTGLTQGKPVKLTSPVITVFSDLSDSLNPHDLLPVLNIGMTYLSIHVSNVTVNGVPLDVGPHCGPAQPVLAVLTGMGHNSSPPTGYTLDFGGPLTGNVTIPSFTNCGAGENLDPLLTASISGPANFQLMTQGTLCTPQNPAGFCPPTVPKPLRTP